MYFLKKQEGGLKLQRIYGNQNIDEAFSWKAWEKKHVQPWLRNDLS